MGTNYYAIVKNCECCKCDKRDSLHIGKTSAGWRFLLHAREAQFETIEDYLNNPLLDYIRNEYDEKISKEQMLEIIQDHKDDKNRKDLTYDNLLFLKIMMSAIVIFLR